MMRKWRCVSAAAFVLTITMLLHSCWMDAAPRMALRCSRLRQKNHFEPTGAAICTVDAEC